MSPGSDDSSFMHPNWTDQITGREKEFEQVRDVGFDLSVNVCES
jgi:hypothetical protein